ncbi:hypothetical protein ACIPTP_14170 [Pectobacterium versatile]|uniref:hypothetical protein n=1 Tax=Pectobacterium versatile TaxID=2488639 RepID=UPI00380A28D6
MEDERRNECLRVFHHELGHWFVAKQVGFEPQYIEVKSEWHSKWISSGSCSTVLYYKCKESDVADYLIKRQLVLLAGAVFEAVKAKFGLDKAINNLQNNTAIDDNKKFMELAMISLNLRLGEIEESVESLCQRINIHGSDDLYQELIMHRERLAGIIYIICDTKINDFLMQSIAIFNRKLDEGSCKDIVTIPMDELEKVYFDTISGYLFPEEIIPFSNGVLRFL